MAMVVASVAVALCLVLAPSPLPSAHALSRSAGGGTSKTSKGEANVVGSGLRLRFFSSPNQAYCLVSDPCLHINGLMAGTPLVCPHTCTALWCCSLHLPLSGLPTPCPALCPIAGPKLARVPFPKKRLAGWCEMGTPGCVQLPLRATGPVEQLALCVQF